jgi:hypothetical protein
LLKNNGSLDLDTRKIVTISNANFLQCLSGLLYGDGRKTEAYFAILKELLNYLSKCEDSEIDLLLKGSGSCSQLPEDAVAFKNVKFSNIAILCYLVHISKPHEVVCLKSS